MRPPSLVLVTVWAALVVSAAAAQDSSAIVPTEPTRPSTTTEAAPPTPGATHATRTRSHTKAASTHAASAHHESAHHAAHASAHRHADTEDATSLSIGRHNRGHLSRGHELRESETLRFKTPRSEAHWGTDELVGLLERASRAVVARTPGARLTVGDLSRRGGGRFRPHRSHQSGRDVDLGFYVTNPEGAPLDLDRFYRFGRDISVRGHDDFHYDFARNWHLVEALLRDEVPVQWIFVSRFIRARLLEEGTRQGASAEVMAHAEAILSQPSHGGAHTDHFHVRIFCPAGDHPRCLDDPPIHPWIAGAPLPLAAAASAAD